MQQFHILYQGRVQGVGFRYTVRRIADTFKLTGWVRNLEDGRVEILAQGDRKTIERMMQTIEEHFQGCIHQKEVEVVESSQLLDGFEITG